jgi:hypothetical protein
MRKRASHEGDILHPGEAEVGDELTASAHEPVIFFPPEAGANALLCHHLLREAFQTRARHSNENRRFDTMVLTIG